MWVSANLKKMVISVYQQCFSITVSDSVVRIVIRLKSFIGRNKIFDRLIAGIAILIDKLRFLRYERLNWPVKDVVGMT